MLKKTFHLGVLATHPIQYHVPLWRKLAEKEGLRLTVCYADDFSVRGEVDPDFGVPVKWDTPMLEGYEHCFIGNSAKKPLPHSHGFWSVNCPQVGRLFDRARFDAVLVHGYAHLFEWQIFRAAWRHRIPVLLRGDSREGTGICRSFFFEQARSFLLRLLYRRIDVGLAVGAYMRRHFLNHGIPESMVVDCPHCVDTDEMERQRRALPPKEILRRELGIPEDALVLVMSGKLTPVKNHVLLAAALKLLPLSEKIWVLVMGDGPLRPEEQAAFEAVIGRRAVFTGFINQSLLGRYYAAGDVLILPSRGETWGLVVNEGMFFGLPAVVSDRVGCREDLIVPGKTGFIYPDNNEEALSEIIGRFARQQNLAREMGAAAEMRIGRYSADAAADGIMEGLDRLRTRKGENTLFRDAASNEGIVQL